MGTAGFIFITGSGNGIATHRSAVPLLFIYPKIIDHKVSGNCPRSAQLLDDHDRFWPPVEGEITNVTNKKGRRRWGGVLLLA